MKGAARNYQAVISNAISSAGIFLDPFVSSVRKACDSNSWVIFESNHLRIRALKDIPSGTEIMISLLCTLAIVDTKNIDFEAPQARKAFLSKNNIECACALCYRGPLGPTEELLARVNKYEGNPFDISGHSIRSPLAEMERPIRDINAAGFGFEACPMSPLYQNALTFQTLQRNTIEALKLCLTIYCQIEPLQTPPTPLHERIDTLFILKSLLGTKHPNANQQVQTLEPLPLLVNNVKSHVVFHLMEKLVSDTAKCFGEDSEAAKFEKYIFVDFIEKLEATALLAGMIIPRYVPLTEDPAVAQKFARDMKTLMEWADLPTLTLDQYLR